MNPDKVQSSFDEAVADPTLWKGYEQWLDEQANISNFELWHEFLWFIENNKTSH